MKEKNNEFINDLAIDWTENELWEKEEELKEYQEAYYSIYDKESYNAEYISSIIFLLKNKIKKIREQIRNFVPILSFMVPILTISFSLAAIV